MMPATIIAIEGPDRVGKFTQSTLLAKALRDDKHKVKLVEVPVKSPVTYRLIYWMLRNGLAKRFTNLFQTLQFFNKWFFQLKLVFWHMWLNDYVIFDRWALSAIIYGDASDANPAYNRFLYKFLREPDATIIMVGAPRNKEATDVYEKDAILQTAVRNGYANWYENHPRKIAMVDNVGSPDDVHARVKNTLERRFELL